MYKNRSNFLGYDICLGALNEHTEEEDMTKIKMISFEI